MYELLALVQSGIVTFPEHILPLVLFSPSSLISAMRSVIASNSKVIALIPIKPDSPAANPSLAHYGTTAEIYEYDGASSEIGFLYQNKSEATFQSDQHME